MAFLCLLFSAARPLFSACGALSGCIHIYLTSTLRTVSPHFTMYAPGSIGNEVLPSTASNCLTVRPDMSKTLTVHASVADMFICPAEAVMVVPSAVTALPMPVLVSTITTLDGSD